LIVIADTREQRPYDFTGYDVQIIQAGLPAGDYSIPGCESIVAIERKTLDDLINCLMVKNRDRFERELGRLRPYHVSAVVVEASWEDISRGRYTSNMNPQSALQSVIAMQVRHNVPFMLCGDRSGAQYVTHGLLSKYAYEIGKQYKAIQMEGKNHA